MKKSEIKINKTSQPKAKPDSNQLGFGTLFTDHMFVMDYSRDKGWNNPQIVPYGPLTLDPSTATFHYGQSTFEGLKAYRSADNSILLFQPQENMKRINMTNERMCIPYIDEEFCLEALKTLLEIEKDWVPDAPDTSLYIRPFIIAADPYLGLRPSKSFKFLIILSPVGAYYPQGINPVNIYVETEYVRAVPGGTGFAKTSGNYAASLKAQAEAEKKGFVQVLWLDGIERKYVEEVGSMNVFFKIDGEVITPALQGSILPGITRQATIDLLKEWGIPVSERKISIKEVFEAAQKGSLDEAFGTGTAAVISPIGELHWNGENIQVNSSQVGEVSSRLYHTITGIQTGRLEDHREWTIRVCEA